MTIWHNFYKTTTKRLNEQIKRNSGRFPPDFMFRLTPEEYRAIQSEDGTFRVGRGGRRYPPNVFTEHGTLMAAMILNTERATQVSVYVVRAFVKLREMVSAQHQLAAKIDELEHRLDSTDESILRILETIRLLMEPSAEETKRRPIGFQYEQEDAKGRAADSSP